jgi:hypothetical protein
MKKLTTMVLAVMALALGVVCVMQSRKSAGQQTQNASLRGELSVKEQQLEDLQAAQERAGRQRRELTSQTEELAAQLRAHQQAATNVTAPAPLPATESEKPADDQSGLGTMLAKMMEDPETRKLIRSQQRMMMDQMYGPLVKQMGLTSEEAVQFKDLLADNAMKAAEKASAMLGGPGSTNRTEMLASLTAEQKSFEEQVKSFLGDTRYGQYKDYQETVSERAMLSQFKLQAGSDYNLSDPQTEALLTFMKEEKKNVAASTGLPLGDSGQDPAKLQALMADDKLEQLLQAQEAVGQRVYERARTILSPEQLNTLGQFQTNQMQMMRVGMSMAKKMFTPDKAGAGVTPGQ